MLMRRTFLLLVLCLSTALVGGLLAQSSAGSNRISLREEAAGWRLLFDGRTSAGWQGMRGAPFPEQSWAVEDGAIRTLPDNSGGDIQFVERFSDFELEFEWKIAKGGNSGVKYIVQEEWISFSFAPDRREDAKAMMRRRAIGLEYQIIDDEKYADRAEDSKTGALYLLHSNPNKNLKRPGLWNRSKIVVDGNHGEHWLNGEKLLEFELGSKQLLGRVSRTKFRQAPGYGRKGPGYIVLTHHNSPAWFRNIRVRDLGGVGAKASGTE